MATKVTVLSKVCTVSTEAKLIATEVVTIATELIVAEFYFLSYIHLKLWAFVTPGLPNVLYSLEYTEISDAIFTPHHGR